MKGKQLIMNKKFNFFYLPKEKGLKHPKCYLNELGGCSKNITKEHFISKAILDWISSGNSIEGIGIIPNNKRKVKIGKNDLVSKILCEEHNNKLGELDACFIEFIKKITAIHNDLKNKSCSQKTEECRINGRMLEQFLFKLAIGLQESSRLCSNYKKMDFINAMQYPFKNIRKGWGLYFQTTTKEFKKEIQVLTSITEEGELKALSVEIAMLKLYLLFGNPDKKSFGVFRPNKLIFGKKKQ